MSPQLQARIEVTTVYEQYYGTPSPGIGQQILFEPKFTTKTAMSVNTR